MKIIWFVSGNPLNGHMAGWVASAYKFYKERFITDDIVIVDMTAKKEAYQNYDGQEVYSIKRNGMNRDNLNYILDSINPDIITVFGTEYPYQCNVIELCCSKWADRTTIWVQGIVSECFNYYATGVPAEYVNMKTFKERFFRRMNLKEQMEDFAKRGELEKKALGMVEHVLGRTEWDKNSTKNINPKVMYHSCNETLREVFYQENNKWRLENCVKHRIIVSSCSYPIKGFHYLLQAVGELIEEYPDVEIVCPGEDFINWEGIDRIRLSSYQVYLRCLVRKYCLQKHIKFIGQLNADAMVNALLKANVFVLCSTIENSSNALGEAMLIGMPIVAAKVGGTETMLSEREGVVFERGDIPALTAGIRKMFRDEEYAKKCASNARTHGLMTHDGARNAQSLHEIYVSIKENEN